MQEPLYKVLDLDGSVLYGAGCWALPANGHPGKWMPKLALPLIPCQHGYHLVCPAGLLNWIGPTLYLAEPSGETIEKDATVLIAQQARLLQRVEQWSIPRLVEFALLCAERSLSQFEQQYPKDLRSRQALEAARAWLNHSTAEAAWAARAAAEAAGAAEAAEREWQNATLLRITGLA